MRTAANGPINPNKTNLTASAEDICPVLQPNSRRSGCKNAPGRPSAAEVVSMVRNATATTTHE